MLLSIIIFFPLIVAVILCFLKKESLVRVVALVCSSLQLLFALAILVFFKMPSAELQLVERYNWIKGLGISYFVGVDGISLWLVILTNFFLPIMILASWNSITARVRGFHIALFLLLTALNGSFLAVDVVLFYVFWELSLIPMYFIIGIWGAERRIYASLKLFIFTMFGSVLMLLAIVYMMYAYWQATGELSASLLDFYKFEIPYMRGRILSPQTLVFFAFSLAFAIKVPIFPFHTWLPDAHVEAPTSGSVVLAAIMLKMGTYAFLRFAIPLFPQAVSEWAWLFLIAGLIGVIYGALVAMAQTDIKKLVAYSSVSHMGYVVIGLFVMNVSGATGGLYQMLNHGLSTGALFILVGIVYERTHSRVIDRYGGLAQLMPLYSIVFLIITLSSIAVPLTNGFVGEFLILLGAFTAQPVIAVFAVCGVVIGAVYMLWLVRRVFFGKPTSMLFDLAGENKLYDLKAREIFILVPIICLIFVMGIYPKLFLQWSQASLDHFVANKDNYQLEVYIPVNKEEVSLRFSSEVSNDN